MKTHSDSIEQVVAAALGARKRSLSDEEVAEAVRAFIAAGRAAVHARHGTLKQAGSALDEGRRLLGQSRRRLAETSAPGDPGLIVEEEWRLYRQVMKASRARLRAYPNVVGWGVGLRQQDGIETGERAVIVYVERKLAPEVLDELGIKPLPESLVHGGTRVPIDVVEVGALEPQVDAGTEIGPAGTSREGTIGALARDPDGSPVALTAMHVTGLSKDFPPGAGVKLEAPLPGPILGRLLRGTRRGVDAAKISIDPPHDSSGMIKGIGKIAGWRPVSLSGDKGATVRMFGAKSRLVSGRIVNPSLDLPKFNLVDAIMVEIPSVDGDSGAAIVDNQNLVLGLLVGKLKGENRRVFSPIGPVLKALGCDIPFT